MRHTPMHSVSYLLLLAFFLFSMVSQASSSRRERHYSQLSIKEKIERNTPDEQPSKPKALQSSKVVPLIEVVRAGKLNTKYREGIDVSRYQGDIDWERVANEAAVSYAYIKATEGAQLVDPYYWSNITAARQAGLSVGSYHFYRAKVSPEVQLANMTSTVRKEDQDLVPIVDIETTNGVGRLQFVADLRDFIERVTAYYGRKPLLYTYQNFYNKYLVGEFPGYQWMIAKYQSEPPILDDDTDYMMWQYTQTGRIPGIRGNVDCSCLMGNHSLQTLQM